ncbi:hypothetical protein PG989_007426 [Apiospora arundinis]
MESSHNENNSAQAGGADTVGPVEHRCPVCGKVLGTTKTLQQHHRIHDKNETCDLCGNGFARVELLKMHKLNKHTTNTSPFICFMGGFGATLADNQKAQAAAIPDAGNGDSPSAEDAAAAPPREYGGMVEHDNGDQRLISTVYEMSMQEYLNQSDRKIQELGNQIFASSYCNLRTPKLCIFAIIKITTTLAPPHTVSGAPVSSGSAAAANPFRCPNCQKTLKTQKSLTQHRLTHRKPHACDSCGDRFARLDQVKVHKHSEHGLNTSSFICFMKPCTRRLLGLKDERSLINHLANAHQGATLRDNDRALAAEHGIELDAQADGASSTDDDMMSTYEEEVLSTNSSDDEGETRFESHELPEKLLSTKAEAREYNPEDPATAEDEIQSKEILDELKRVSLILKEY